MLDDNELLFDELYEKTKDCGRVQFIKLLMQKERENNELRERLVENSKINIADHKYASECEDKVITMENQQKEFIDYLKEQINECKLSGNDEDYVRADVYEEILFKIERR